ncbi:MAG: hypothetical protein U0169_18820 [Polyangiaceae bacterium]
MHVDANVPAADVKALFTKAYADEPFVRVPKKRLPEVVAVKGTNFAEIGIEAGDVRDGKRVFAIFSATDHLIKGGAGQAIQSMNLMLGLPETTSLEDVGSWP